MDKPFKTHEEMIAILHSRGLETDTHAEFVLEREGYYPIVNGYKDPFLDREKTLRAGDDRYIEGASFSEVYSLFVFDRHLRSILFKYITIAEAALKSVCSYQFSARHVDDNEAYLDESVYRNDGRYADFVHDYVIKLKRELGRDPKRKNGHMRDYLVHYSANHDNVPLWVLMNELTLGDAFKFYDFQPESLRFAIAQRFQVLFNKTHRASRRITHASLRKSYDHIKDFRNICAHDERLYCARVDKSKSTTFADVLSDLDAVLWQKQHDKLKSEIVAELMRLSTHLESVGVDSIVPMMGFGSVSDLM